MNLFGEQVTAPKTYFRGTHRSVSPAETLRRFLPRLPVLGITRLADITGLDAIGLPVYVAIRPNSRTLATSQGKGFDHDSAKASAMMESVEAWHAERPGIPLVHDSYRSLRRSHSAVDPLCVAISAGNTPRHDVPYLWARGWDLLREEWTHVPYELVTSNFVFPPGFRPTFSMGSNGLASGNHLLEAINHALAEVIERDAHALWSLRGAEEAKRTAVDLASVEDPACRGVLALLDRAGIGVIAWDMTSDTGVSAYACQIVERPDNARWRVIGPTGGYGCHLSSAIALMRALTEAVQSRLTLISGSRDDMFYRTYEASGDRDNLERAWRLLSRTEGLVPFGARASLDTPTLDGDLRVLLDRVKNVGITSAVVVDLSRAEIGVPVVKVIVPGLEGHNSAHNYRAGARALALASSLGKKAS
jgi:YcaO-like protein with predicted kinase domain